MTSTGAAPGSSLVVLTFKTLHGADDVVSAIHRMSRQDVIHLDDAAIVVRDGDGRPKIKQAANLVGVGALGGAFWGLIIGLLFMAPWLGVAVGAAAGSIGGSMADIGVDDDFIREVGDRLRPGTSALFLLSGRADLEKLAHELSHFDFEIAQTNLPADKEAELRAIFEED
jgi:uncharacterized membrane protein